MTPELQTAADVILRVAEHTNRQLTGFGLAAVKLARWVTEPQTAIDPGLLQHLPPGPWAYRPDEYDDWGFVRDANGDLVANTCSGATASDFQETAKSGTDEWKAGPPRARAVAALLIAARADLDAEHQPQNKTKANHDHETT